MKIRAILLASLALLLAMSPVGVQAARAQTDDEPLAQQEQRPLETLMEVRQELQLTDAQVSRLQQIALRLDATNRPLRQELVRRWQAYREQRRTELLRMTPAQRQAELERIRAQQDEQGRPPVPAELQPLVRQIRGNIAMAMREAGTVLTPAQKARARELVRARRQARGGGLGGRGRGMGRRGLGGRGRLGGRP
jgi:flagellar basal body-associated protein FliL